MKNITVLSLWIITLCLTFVSVSTELVADEAATTTSASANVANNRAEIFCSDGGRFFGRIVRMEDGKLIVETTIGGELSLNFEEIIGIQSSEPITVQLSDGSRVVGVMNILGDGRTQMKGEALGETVFELKTVAAINPTDKSRVTQTGNITANLDVDDGNTQSKAADLNADYEMRVQKHRLSLRAGWEYAEEDGELTDRSASAFAKYDFFLTEKLFCYGNFSLEGDEAEELELRTATGIGAGYQVIDEGRCTLYGETGLTFLNEDFDNDFTRDDQRLAARLSIKASLCVIPDRLDLFTFSEGFLGLEDQDDAFALTESGARIMLIGGIFANLQMNFDWDNIPVPGKERRDWEYLAGLGYAFDF